MHPILLIVFLPLLAALVAGLTNKAAPSVFAKAITTGALFVSAALSWPIFLGFVAGTYEPTVVPVLKWVQSGSLAFDWALRVDTLTAIMLVVINTVSALVHLYSWGYMDEDPDQPRFFAYLSLFTFAMLMLVTADNLVQMFFGWEGVGLASYLLIGFWFRKPSASAAAIKAFVVNRVGDLGFMLGIFGTYLVFDTVSITEILAAAPGMSGATIGFLGYNVYTMDVLCVLLFIGAMGKSAQLGLHTWLPDAMEGPTPVSALIHAATMVTAGVFMVCRLSPMFETAPVALGLVTFIGAATCIFAATVGTTQWDIKRVIAYSTCSQLGYMFFAAGVGAYEAAMFHLFTHAFFKALLFLGAGSVIHGMHHEQDMRKMGGLAKFMPLTYAAMMVGTIAIIGLGVPHTKLGFAGFFSKDAILESAFAGGVEHVAFGQMAFWFGIVAAFLTSFYSWRLIYMTFHGPRASESAHDDHAHAAQDAHDDHAHDDHGHDHDHTPHESPMVMLIPLGLLSLGAIFAGFFFYDYFVDHSNEAFWAGAIYRASENHVLHARHEVPEWVIYAPLIVTLGGFLLATMTYFFNRGVGKRIADTGGPLYSLFYNKWYFDEIYNATLVRGAAFLGNIFWKADKKVIDGVGADGMTALTLFSARRLSAMHTGRLYHYAFVIIGAALVFGALMWLNAGGAN